VLRQSDLTEVAPGIFYAPGALITADASMIAFLKAAAMRTPLKRARVCAHPSPETIQHDMLIVSHRDTYVAPHRHFGKSETMLVIEGLADAIIFDEAGGVVQHMQMGPVASGRVFFYRMPERTYHSLLIDSEVLVFVESTKGPFRAQDSENAPWAPVYTDVVTGRQFIETVVERCARAG
jgi:cupin fold WbuC family metalloprotein